MLNASLRYLNDRVMIILADYTAQGEDDGMILTASN